MRSEPEPPFPPIALYGEFGNTAPAVPPETERVIEDEFELQTMVMEPPPEAPPPPIAPA